MNKRRNNIEYKTALFLGLSTVIHAGLLVYVAAAHYGGDAPHAADSVVVDFTPTSKSSENSTEAVIATPVPAVAPAPKIVTETKTTKLPEKSQAVVAKSEEKNEAPVVSESSDSIPVPVATTATVAAPFEPIAEPAVEPATQALTVTPEEQLAEQIQNDVITPAPEALPETLPDTATEASAVVPASVPAEAAVVAAATSGTAEKTTAVPVRQASELRSMPGNQYPNYTFDDRLSKREGEIKFLAEVTPEGAVTNVRMLKSTGHKSLDLAALKSFKNYRYQPGQQGYILKSFNFVLKGPARQLPSRLADRDNNSLAK
mgnify:CR=1 FL=1